MASFSRIHLKKPSRGIRIEDIAFSVGPARAGRRQEWKSSLDQGGAINLLEDLREALIGQHAKIASHKWGLSFAEVMPVEEIAQSPLEKVRNFAKCRLQMEAPKITPPPLYHDLPPRQRPSGPGFKM